MNREYFLEIKMKRGDEDAMDQFVEQYYKYILNYCHYHCYDKQAAQDLTQETFTRFFMTLASYRSIGKARNYLYVIARNVCLDYEKKKKEIVAENLPEEMEYPMEKVNRSLDVASALERLPEELKEVVILYFFQSMSLGEVAAVLRIGLPLVKYRYKRAKKLLAEYLGREDL